ncbi:MAG TPA: hypothetical protein VF892_08300 [Pseudonocardiaceae bacterium]
MKDFARRFKIAFDKFITDVVAPGMIGFAPMLLPLRDPVPDEYRRFEEELHRAQLADPGIPYQRIVRSLPWASTWRPAVEEQN